MTVHHMNVAPFGVPKSNFPQPNHNVSSAPSTPSENTSAAGTEASRAAADARVEQDYGKQHSVGSRVSVPPESTLGRWVAALKFATDSSAFTQLENIFGGRGAFTHLDHNKGEIYFDGGHNKVNRDSPELNDVPGGKALFDDLMVIAKAMAPYGTLSRRDVFALEGAGHDTNTVDSSVVGQFIHGPGSKALPDHDVPVDILRKTGEAQTQHNLLAALKEQIVAPGKKPDLESIVVEIAPHSGLWREDQQQPVTMNLKQLMAAYGLQVPTTLEALANLERVLFAPPLSAPSAGDYGGLLTKSVPLGEDAQKKISETVSAWKALQTQVALDAGGKAPSLFEYLKRAVPESLRALAETDPEAFLKALIDTPQARALGKQLQEAIGALPSATSRQEALLTALGLQANPSSAGLERDNLAGYNLRQPDNVGRTPAQIVKRFETHMEGIVGPEMAKVAAYQLLAMSAPEFLVKDVPESVVFGSLQWVMFSAEVFRREQSTPGSSAGKRYDQIRERAALEPVTLEQEYQSKAAAVQAVIDWGIAKDIIKKNSEGYSAETISSVTTAMEKEADRLAVTLKGVLAPLPIRRNLALSELTRVYGEENAHLFDKNIMTRRSGVSELRASLLDLYMSGTLDSTWNFGSSAISTDDFQKGLGKLPNIKESFAEQFETYTEGYSKAAGEMFLNQVSQLPSEDRKRLEFGGVQVMYLGQPDSSVFPKGSEALAQAFGAGAYIITTSLKGEKVQYVYSPLLGKIIKSGDSLPGVPEGWSINRNYKHPLLSVTVGGQEYGLRTVWDWKASDERPEPHTLAPLNTPTERSDFFVKHINSFYHTAANWQKDAAYGLSDSEKRDARLKMATGFLLSLLPLHDLIKNIIEGNKHDAVVSGLYDVIGLFNPAAKAGFKAASVGTKGVSSALAFFKGAAKAGGKAANPLGPFFDASSGLFKLGKTALKAAPSVDLPSFANKLHLPGRGSWNIPHGGYKQTIADGTYRPLGERGDGVPVVAVKQGNHWYAFDHYTLKPYGPVLKDFTPITVKELRDLRYDTATAIKYGAGHAQTAGAFEQNEAGPTQPRQPSALQAAR